MDTIRSKLFGFALLATLIPSFSLAWLSFLQNKGAVTAKVTQELQTAGAQATRELDLWVKERVYELHTFTLPSLVVENLQRLSSGAAPAGARRLSDYLGSIRERLPDYEELMVLGPRGGVIASSSSTTRGARLPPGWEREIDAGDAVLGAPVWDSVLSMAVMVVAVPIQSGTGGTLGTLAARLNLSSVEAIVSRLAPIGSGRTTLVALDGTVISGTAAAGPATAALRLAGAAMTMLLQEPGIVHEYSSYDGLQALGALQPAGRSGWSVLSEVPVASAYSAITRMRNMTVLLVSADLVVVGLLAWLLGIIIIRPLNRLTRGAAEVAAGDLAVDLPVVGSGEVGYLTHAFNDMVARLRESRATLERLSVTDGLTGLYNRRHLMERLRNETSRARRTGQPFAVVMLDIDDFKAYNDTYGHLGGDEVLTRVAAVLIASTRQVDCVARYGGEEFLLLLPDTGMASAVEVGERIREAVKAERFAGGHVTVSLGVATFPEFGASPEGVIMSADVALYQAKSSGRDALVAASPESPTA